MCVVAIVSGCQSDPLHIPNQPDRTPVVWKRFDRAFFESDSTRMGVELDRLRPDFGPFLEQGDLGFWRRQRKDSLMNALSSATQALETQWSKSEASVDEVLRHYAYYYPKSKDWTVYSYVSPLDYDFPLFTADSLVFIALDQYLGPTSPFYRGLPAYLARQKHPERIALDLALSLAMLHNTRDPRHADLLARMVYEGKALWFAHALSPDLSEAELLGYTPEQWQFCIENEAEIWRYLVEERALYSSEPDWTRRLIDPAPFSKFYLSFDAQTPGQMGRWVGYRMVSRLMERKGAPGLGVLMADDDSRQLLKKANYRP